MTGIADEGLRTALGRLGAAIKRTWTAGLSPPSTPRLPRRRESATGR